MGIGDYEYGYYVFDCEVLWLIEEWLDNGGNCGGDDGDDCEVECCLVC